MSGCCGFLCGDAPNANAYLFAFDFDHTVVSQNSDSVVIDVLKNPIPEDIQKAYDGTNWSEYMDRIFRFVASEGATVDVIAKQIKKLKPTPGMLRLFQRIMINKRQNRRSKLIIVSDANTFFIETFFKNLKPAVKLDAVITNKAVKAPENYLKLTPYEEQDTCVLCPRNLCKGNALVRYITEHGPFKTVFYVGDGGNDICPASRLRENDIVFVRKGYAMERIILQGTWKNTQVKIRARVVFWDDAREIEDIIDWMGQ